jgi:hypothetical protein
MGNYWGGGMPTKQQIKTRKRCWIGHTLCKPQGAIEWQAMDFIKVQGWGVDKGNLENKKENGNCRRQEKERSKMTCLG